MGHHQLLDGLLVFGATAGLTPPQLLRAATSEAAACCRLQGRTGSLAEGLAADLLVLRGDPLLSPEAALRAQLLVVCRGQMVEPCRPLPPSAARPSWLRPGEADVCRCTERMRRPCS